ncbi:MAG: hypothetical protein ACRD9W_02385, partial [Terriglobia bacterium]
ITPSLLQLLPAISVAKSRRDKRGDWMRSADEVVQNLDLMRRAIPPQFWFEREKFCAKDSRPCGRI